MKQWLNRFLSLPLSFPVEGWWKGPELGALSGVRWLKASSWQDNLTCQSLWPALHSLHPETPPPLLPPIPFSMVLKELLHKRPRRGTETVIKLLLDELNTRDNVQLKSAHKAGWGGGGSEIRGSIIDKITWTLGEKLLGAFCAHETGTVWVYMVRH